MSAKVIAIDGPAYVGKSQIAQALSKMLGFSFINTGHMYRAMARWAIENGINAEDEDAVVKIPMDIRFDEGKTMIYSKEGGVARNWTDQLDKVDYVELASRIAKFPRVRERLTQMQRGYASTGWIVMEGRDIGTEVFPDAEWKFYVTASEEIRARRLLKSASPADRENLDFAAALHKIRMIDDADKNRKIAPLRKAVDAIEYDNTESPDAGEDAAEIAACIKIGKERSPRSFAYGIHR